MTARTLADIWPFFGLTISTPRLTLAYPNDEMISSLVALADEGIHPAESSPFAGSWSLKPPAERSTAMAQFHWQARSTLSPDKWQLPFAVIVDKTIVGTQDVFTETFTTTRVATTGSWLGQAHQGKGIGTEMRRAVLYLAFEGFGAESAETEAFTGNAASRGVTEKLGYQANGETIAVRGDGTVDRMVRYRLERAQWIQSRPDDITIEGLEPCLAFLGLQASAEKPGPFTTTRGSSS